MLDRLIAGYCTVLNYLLAIALALMVVLVFGNVVLRYAFNSGISLSEELSRWLFVWMTFLGAVTALGDRAHLGTDMLVGRLGRRGKQFCRCPWPGSTPAAWCLPCSAPWSCCAICCACWAANCKTMNCSPSRRAKNRRTTRSAEARP